MNIPPDFVNTLKRWRKARGLSQQQAAKRLGIGRPYLSQIENGRPPGELLVNKVLAEVNSPPPPPPLHSTEFSRVAEEAARSLEEQMPPADDAGWLRVLGLLCAGLTDEQLSARIVVLTREPGLSHGIRMAVIALLGEELHRRQTAH